MNIDTSELEALARDLQAAPEKVQKKVRRDLGKRADAVRNTMRADAAKSRHFKFAGTISKSIVSDGLEAEVGPEKRGAGNLAHIAYFGGVNGGGGTVRDPAEALAEHEAPFEAEVGDAAEDIL